MSMKGNDFCLWCHGALLIRFLETAVFTLTAVFINKIHLLQNIFSVFNTFRGKMKLRFRAFGKTNNWWSKLSHEVQAVTYPIPGCIYAEHMCLQKKKKNNLSEPPFTGLARAAAVLSHRKRLDSLAECWDFLCHFWWFAPIANGFGQTIGALSSR